MKHITAETCNTLTPHERTKLIAYFVFTGLTLQFSPHDPQDPIDDLTGVYVTDDKLFLYYNVYVDESEGELPIECLQKLIALSPIE